MTQPSLVQGTTSLLVLDTKTLSAREKTWCLHEHITEARVQSLCMHIVDTMALRPSSIEWVLTTSYAMRALNRAHRQKDYATDVLTFPLLSAHNGVIDYPVWNSAVPYLLGSVVIALPVAKRQAADMGHSLWAECVRLWVHGMCHLVGYDHERSRRDETIMFREEDRILQACQPQFL